MINDIKPKKERPKRVRYVMLNNDVMAVAVEGEIKDWFAYIGAVNQNNPTADIEKIKAHGNKLRQDIAEILFPDFYDLKWRA
jgi:hypothetical protein